MGKKAKKQQAEIQVVENEEAQEVVEPTIVESMVSEVFGPSTDLQAVVTVAAEETAIVPEQPVETPVVGVVPADKPKKSNKRPYIEYVQGLLENGVADSKTIVKLVLEKFPTVNKSGIQTFVTDLKNPKYRHWRDRAVVVNQDGKLQFMDAVVTAPVAEEVVTPEAVPSVVEEAQLTEQPAE